MPRRACSVEVEHTLEWCLYGIVRYTPGHEGTMYQRNGDPGDPPEPSEFEILMCVSDEDGNAVALPKGVLDAVIRKHREAIEMKVAEIAECQMEPQQHKED